MTDEHLKDTSNQNPNNTGPAVVGRKNFMEDPTMQEAKKDDDGPKLHEKHRELNIPKPNAEHKPKQNNEAKTGSESQKPASEAPGSTVDDSIVDSKVPAQPNMSVDSPAAKLIKDKTYRLPVHRGANKTKFKVILMIWFISCVIIGSVYVLVF